MEIIPKITLRIGEPDDFNYSTPGKPVSISDDEAAKLIEAGLAESTDTKPVNLDSDDIIADIIEAIDGLAPESFGKDGEPNVKALEEFTGYDISAAQRDDAWQEYQAIKDDD